MKVAIAQLQASADKDINLLKAKEYIKKAKDEGANLIVFPEGYMAHLGVSSTLLPADIAETIDGSFVSGLAEAARENQIYVICGVFEIKPDEEKRAYNTAVLISSSGELLHQYRKTHLYDAFTFKESDKVAPSTDSYKVVETEFGKIGLMICYELRFPEIARQLTLQGADMIFVPTAWVAGNMKEHHWKTLLMARAIENTVYVIGSDQVGNIYSGNSMAVDPMGVVLASAGEEESLILAEIDLDRLRRVRENVPCIVNRRSELLNV